MIEYIKIFHLDFKKALEDMPYDSVGRLMKALMAFARDEDPHSHLEGDIRAQTLYPVLEGHIIRNEEYRRKKSKAGKANAKSSFDQDEDKPITNNQGPTPILSYPILSSNNTVVHPSVETSNSEDRIIHTLGKERLRYSEYKSLTSIFGKEKVDTQIQRIIDRPYYGCLNVTTISDWCQEKKSSNKPVSSSVMESKNSDQLEKLAHQRAGDKNE